MMASATDGLQSELPLPQPPPPPQQQQLHDHHDHHDIQQALAAQSMQQQQQQNQQQQVQQQVQQQQQQQTGPIDSLTCQWLNCGERCSSPEALYEHCCERHIGRKSTNNLNLTCHWGACRTTTVKRDHITSHLRVHVPLKPHKCDFCGKSFKRPQDLKKHVKTHADDSVLLRSPEANMGQQGGPNNGFQQQDNKANAYFQGGHDMSGGYPPPPGQTVGSNSNFYPGPQQYSGYGQVNYPGTNLGDQQSMDSRRRAIEALNDFLGDVKRRALDPGSYYDVGQRLNTQSLPLPVSSGAGYSLSSNYHGGNGNGGFGQSNNMMDSFGGSNGGGMSMNGGGGVQGPLTQSYSLPMSNARTKTDLLDIDKFLEQLQATIYETSNHASAAGIQQPGVHAIPGNYPGFNNYNRNGSSPPQYHHGSTSSAGGVQPLTSVAQMANMSANAQSLDTPALTPASVSSYASSGHSPMSSHSRSSTDANSMYPQLPSVTGISDMGSGYSSAPPSGLASGFDGFEGRRYSGGRLQRQAPARGDSDIMDLDDERNATPTKQERPDSSSNVDPALRGELLSDSPDQKSGALSDSPEDRGQEAWVENVRVIEQLRNWVRERLSQGEFERDEDSTPEPNHPRPDMEIKYEDQHLDKTDPRLEQFTDPALEEQSAGDHQEHEEEQIAYPTLKVEA